MNVFSINDWTLTADYKNSEVCSYFTDLKSVLVCQGELIAKDRLGEVIRFTKGQRAFYIKRYHRSGRRHFSRFRKSRVRAEWENLLFMVQVGLPVPQLVAYGEQKVNGQFVAGALITEEVNNTCNIAQFLSVSANIQNTSLVNTLIDRLADWVRQMHGVGFIHQDLNLRNVLVQIGSEPAVYFIDCPAGKRKIGYALHRGKIRDLAHLDKAARYLLTDRQLLRFYKHYRQITQLTPTDKKRITKIRHFHDRHRAKQQRPEHNPYRKV